MFRPLKLNEFLNEVVQKEPSFKCVFLANSNDGSIIATNDWSEKAFMSNLCALWEDSNYIGQFKMQDDDAAAAAADELGEFGANQPNMLLQTQIINHDKGTVILQNICNHLLFGICSNQKNDTNHSILLQKAQNVKQVIENEVKKIVPQQQA